MLLCSAKTCEGVELAFEELVEKVSRCSLCGRKGLNVFNYLCLCGSGLCVVSGLLMMLMQTIKAVVGV